MIKQFFLLSELYKVRSKFKYFYSVRVSITNYNHKNLNYKPKKRNKFYIFLFKPDHPLRQNPKESTTCPISLLQLDHVHLLLGSVRNLHHFLWSDPKTEHSTTCWISKRGVCCVHPVFHVRHVPSAHITVDEWFVNETGKISQHHEDENGCDKFGF